MSEKHDRYLSVRIEPDIEVQLRKYRDSLGMKVSMNAVVNSLLNYVLVNHLILDKKGPK